MNLITILLIINTFLLFSIFIKVNHALDRIEGMDEFIRLFYEQFWRR